MNRLRRYWTLWRTLPAVERRERLGRLRDRLLRQRPTVRRLGLAPDPPSWRSFSRALLVDRTRLGSALRAPCPSRGPLFSDLDERAAQVAANHPDHVLRLFAQSRALLDGRFDLLGTGVSRLVRADSSIDWHRDWSSGRDWPATTYYTDVPIVRGDGSDVKRPWELARFQHLLVLGQCFLLAKGSLPASEAAELRTGCARLFLTQVDDWITSNPRGVGIHWSCAMEVAIRGVSWLAGWALMRQAPELDDGFVERLVRALWVHGRHVRRNLEIGGDGLKSNHYLSDVIGLYALGSALPELAEAESWRQLARQALLDEMEQQVLPDGVNFERSLPYHRLVTEIFLHGAILARCRQEPFSRGYLERLGLMLEFTATCTRKDGTVPQWGDNDDGRFFPLDGYATDRPHDHRHLLVLGGRFLARDDLTAAGGGAGVESAWLLGSGRGALSLQPAGMQSREFSDARYYVMRHDDLHAAVACGPVGTDGVGNHSHNDLMAPVIWADGVEWVADPGSGSYTGDPRLRNRLRATAAHATLQLGHREQNAFGDTLDDLFLLRERARPQVDPFSSDEAEDRLTARHFGFADPQNGWVHERTIRLERRNRRWLIRDRLWRPDGETNAKVGTDPILIRFPLAPGLICEVLPQDMIGPPALESAFDALGMVDGVRERSAIRLSGPEAQTFWIALDLPAGSLVELVDGLYSPRYGMTLGSRVIRATLPPGPDTTALSALWSPSPRS